MRKYEYNILKENYKLLNKLGRRTIYQCFDKPSSAKVQSYYNILDYYMKDYNIINDSITSYNCMSYVLTLIIKDNKDNVYLIVETKEHTYEIDLCTLLSLINRENGNEFDKAIFKKVLKSL